MEEVDDLLCFEAKRERVWVWEERDVVDCLLKSAFVFVVRGLVFRILNEGG